MPVLSLKEMRDLDPDMFGTARLILSEMLVSKRMLSDELFIMLAEFIENEARVAREVVQARRASGSTSTPDQGKGT
jgi:hypothetical protein